jgi:hypothetical protein
MIRHDVQRVSDEEVERAAPKAPPVDVPDDHLWHEALWGAGLVGFVLLTVVVIALLSRP